MEEKNNLSLKNIFSFKTFVPHMDKIFAFSSFVLAVSYLIYNDKNRVKKLKELFNNKSFALSAFVALMFSIWGLYFTPEDETGVKLRTATKHAIIAFLIGMFHHFEFKVGPFWFIWLVSYYLDLSE